MQRGLQAFAPLNISTDLPSFILLAGFRWPFHLDIALQSVRCAMIVRRTFLLHI